MMAKIAKLFVCFSVFVVVLSVSVFATSDFSSQPIPYYESTPTNAQLRSNGFVYAVNGSSNCYILTKGNNCVYMFYCPRTDNNVGYSVVCVSVDGNHYNTWRNTSSTGLTTIGTNDFYSDNSWYYSNSFVSSDFASSWNIPYYDNLDAGMSGLASYLGISSSYSSFNIPIGYVAVFDNTSDISLSTYFPTKSVNLYVPELGYWGYTAQQFGLISGNVPTSYPTNSGSSIIWSKSDPMDIWGNTYHGVSSITGAFGKLYIYNPVYRNFSRITAEYDPSGINGTITVSGRGISNFKLYPVTAGFGLHDDIIGDIDTNDYFSVEIDPDTEQPIYTDPEDNPVVEPAPGGSTLVPEEVSNQNFLEKILQVLRNLLSEIGSLFTFAYDAVSSLVSAATSFFAVIAGLFVWLPEEVVTVVISGFVLVVTIGVLKSFL